MAWPVTLPILNEGYSLDDELPVIRTEMEQGPPRVTRISTSYMTNLQVQCLLTDAQMTIYRAYFHGSECQAGAGWFDMPIMTGGAVIDHEVRITSSSASRDGLHWRLSLGLETEEHN